MKAELGKIFQLELSAKHVLLILTCVLMVLAVAFLWNGEARGVIFSRLARKSVSQRLKAISAAKPWIVDAANQIKGGLVILVFKDERLVELHAKGWDSPRIYKMTGFNGKLGPKLREGDGQIPEGVYGIEYLNPNSAFHLSLKVSYPNSFDKRHAQESGRDNLGNDIMIHGRSATVGCVPIGDDAIEEVFYFAARVGKENTSVIIAPYDMRKGRKPELEQSPLPWYGELCDEIGHRLSTICKGAKTK